MGITVNYKTLSLCCVKPRQRNSGVHRCQILCRIRFYRSGRRNLPQFRGLQRFDELDRGIFRRLIFRGKTAVPAPSPKKWKNQKMKDESLERIKSLFYLLKFTIKKMLSKNLNLAERQVKEIPALPPSCEICLRCYFGRLELRE